MNYFDEPFQIRKSYRNLILQSGNFTAPKPKPVGDTMRGKINSGLTVLIFIWSRESEGVKADFRRNNSLKMRFHELNSVNKEKNYNLQTRKFLLISEVLEKAVCRIAETKPQKRAAVVFASWLSLLSSGLRVNEISVAHLGIYTVRRRDKVKASWCGRMESNHHELAPTGF